jgi:hypothetical protein
LSGLTLSMLTAGSKAGTSRTRAGLACRFDLLRVWWRDLRSAPRDRFLGVVCMSDLVCNLANHYADGMYQGFVVNGS